MNAEIANGAPADLGCRPRPLHLFGPFGANDEPGRGGAHKVKRITSDQGQDLTAARSQHSDVIGAHHLRGYDAIAVLAGRRGQLNQVARANISQWPEERVAVSGNTNVPRLARQRSAFNMTDRMPEGPGSSSLHDDDRNAEARNLDAANQASGRGLR